MVATTKDKDERVGPRNLIEGSTRRQMFFSIWFNQTYQGIQITLAYNISVYLVRHFSAGESEERIGQLTGILASAFSSAQFCTSYGWGLITDKVGRKPVVVLANFIMGIATLGLGLAPTYWLAVMARCLGGAANGSGVAIKTMLAEACDATSQARGMAFLNLGWGMGNILGPMIGGFLSQPCDRWPNFPLCDGGNGLFARQPFLPPCLVVGVLSLLAMTNSAFMMVETHPRMRKLPKKAPGPKKAPAIASMEDGTSVPNSASVESGILSEEKKPLSMFAKSAQVPDGLGRPSIDEPASPMMSRLSSGIGAGKEEARQMLRRASSRFNGLLSGYRSLSVQSDDLDRHEYVLEMSNTREPDNGVKPGSGWEDRQGLVPNEHPQAPEEALGSLPRLSESPKKAGDPDAAADSLTASHRRHSLGGAMTSSRAPRTPRFFFGRSSSLQEGAEQAGSGGASQGKSMFGRWKRKGDYSALENQEDIWKHAESRQAAMDEDFRADSSDEDEFGEDMPMLQRNGSAAINAKLSFELPGQSGLQDWVGGGQVPVSPRPSGRLLSGQLSSRLSAHLPSQLPAEQLQTAVSKPESSLEEGGLEPRVPWYRQRSLQLVLAGYASIAFLMNFLEELTPIYASAPYRLGGLNLTPDQIALPVSFAGLGLVFFALLVYPRVQRRLGCMSCAKLGLILAIPLALAIPMSSFAAPHYAAIQACLIPTMGFKAICSIMCMTSSMILVNLTAPLEDIGPVNGFGNMLAAGMRALGPALAGQLWALSLAVVDSGAQFVAFGVVASAFLCTRLLYGRMRI